MKSLIKTITFIIISTVSILPALANTTGLKVNVTALTPIAMEAEEGVDDVYFSVAEQARYTNLNVSEFHPDSLEVEDEEASADVEFSTEEVQRYRRHEFENRIQQLIPVAQEPEEGINDLNFSAIEKEN